MDARDNSIFIATQPEPYRILGLKLLPFSLGHYFILTRHGCAFVSDSLKGATRADLTLACLVCSMTYEQWREFSNPDPMSFWERLLGYLPLYAPSQERKLRRHGQRIALTVLQWGRKIGVFDLKVKASLFQKYLTDNSTSPKYWVLRENKDESGGHWAHNVLVTLTGELGFSQSEAMNMPLREALMHFYKHAESLGIVRLMTPEEIQLADDMEKEAV